MKQLLFLITLTLFISACGNTDPAAEWPTDLAGKKALLKEKKAAIKALEKDLERLESEIADLEPNKKPSRKPVTMLTVKQGDFKQFVEVQGSVQSDDLVSASSEAGGRILKMDWQEGQSIRKGQLVAKLDLEQVNKQIAELDKSLELAVEIYERQKRLWDQNIGSEIQFLQAKNNKERIEKSLETVRFQLTKAEVYAPISGLVERVVLKSGELATPGMPILQILNTSKVKVVAAVPENLLKAVKKGEMVTLKFPALDLEKEARVTLIGSMINPANRTFEVEVNLPNSQGIFKPNLLATMSINDLTIKDAIMIPIELVQQEVTGKDFVYVKGEGAQGAFAKKIYVKTGESFEGEIVIEEGLKGNDMVIKDGARTVAENELIQVK